MIKMQSIGIKRYLLKRWIYEHGYTQFYVAREMGISLKEFKWKLLKHKKFNRKQIERLVLLMGAEAAFEVLFFPTYEIRQKVKKETFGIKAHVRR